MSLSEAARVGLSKILGQICTPDGVATQTRETNLKDRKTFVADLLKGQPDMSQLELSRTVKEAFGTGLSFTHIRQLRAAHDAGNFNRVWSELFGLEEAAPEGGGRRKKQRGDRRRKTQLRGRRNLDRDKFLLSSMNKHLVVYRTEEGVMNSQSFKSRERAEKLVGELIEEGIPAEEIGYFHRSEVTAKAA